MKYHDPIYGDSDVTEAILLDLIASKAVQRLKGVLQHGISGLIGVTEPITRFEHSLGTMLLVRWLGASVEEQIAALLHDVSHTAFSHVIDYVFDGHVSQSFHDEQKQEYIAGTGIPNILAEHGHDWHDYLREEKFPLLEQPSPRLCADRLDYFLRDSLALRLASKADIDYVLRRLVAINGRIAVTDLSAARWLAYTYIAADDASWANFREVGLYEVTARAIKIALRKEILTEADFWLTDEVVWTKLQVHDDPELQALLRLISPGTRFLRDDDRPTFQVSTKVRSIDPELAVDGQPRPLSTLDPDFAEHRAAYLRRKRGKWSMRVVALEESSR